MYVLFNYSAAVASGVANIFSDFETGGDMWSGHGKRERRVGITFPQPFVQSPVVHLSLSMFDVDQSRNTRLHLFAENVTDKAFDVVFRIWGDTRVARASAAWMAIGEYRNPDDWDV